MNRQENPKWACDLELAQMVVGGDEAAFQTLYARYNPEIYSLCLRMTGNRADAEQFCQDTWLQAFRKISTFRGESAFVSWLYRLATNEVLMDQRKASARHALYTQSLDAPSKDEDGLSLIERLGEGPPSHVNRLTLEKLILRLPPGKRTIFRLRFIEGYKLEEVALILGCSVGNVRGQSSRARARLLKQWRDGLPE